MKKERKPLWSIGIDSHSWYMKKIKITGPIFLIFDFLFNGTKLGLGYEDAKFN